jgi:hypothetical protein
MGKVITDINKRWLEGIEHHPKAIKIVKALCELDFQYGNDALDLSFGGDGDNGEHLAYLLSIYFEEKEQGE